MPLFESGTENANGNRWLALANIAVFILGFAASYIFHAVHSPAFFVTEAVVAGATGITATIGLKDTFVEHQEWKTYVQVVTTIASFFVWAFFIHQS